MFLLLTFCVLPLVPNSFAQELPKLYSVDSYPYGTPFSEHAAEWWQYHVSIPKEIHPRSPTSEQGACPVGDVGQVSYLTHNIQGRSELFCDIQQGKAIFLNIVGGECDEAEIPGGSESDLILCASQGNDYSTFTVSIDGNVMNVHPDNDNRTRSGFFDITYPQDNLYDVPAGTYKAVVDGYYAFIEPLPHGEHLVRIDASVNNPTDPSYNFAYGVLYHMNVQ